MPDALEDLEKKLELLKEVHTQEDLERVGAELEEARRRALAESPAYRQLLEERRLEAEVRADKIQHEYESKISDAKFMANHARGQAERLRNLMPGKLLQNIKADTGFKCPRCGETNLNWKVTERGKHEEKTPWCFRCNMKMLPKDSKEIPRRTLNPHQAQQETLKRIRGMT